MIVDAGRLRTLRSVSLSSNINSGDHKFDATHLIFSLTLASASSRFHKLTISSLCLTLIVQPQISGHSVLLLSLLSSQFPIPSFSSVFRHSSNWSPIIASTRSSQIRSATPFLRRMIHLPPVMLSGSSHTGRRIPVWKSR